MLPKELYKLVNQSMISFLWRQWSQLGIAGDLNQLDKWIIDPEALILFSMKFARYDSRLFDEILDWILRNERWISLQRLKTLLKEYDNDTIKTVIALSRTIDEKLGNARWKFLANYRTEEKIGNSHFFLTFENLEIPVIKKPDLIFASVGWLRSTPEPRGLSREIPFISPVNLIFQLRSLFGLSPRAEILAYLLSHDQSTVSNLVHSTAYTRPPIHDSLNALLDGGFIEFQSVQKRKVYTLNFDRWIKFLSSVKPIVWVEWQRVFVAINQLSKSLNELQENPISEYVLKSRLISLSEKLHQGLSASGIPNPFSFHYTIDNIPTELPLHIQKFLKNLESGQTR